MKNKKNKVKYEMDEYGILATCVMAASIGISIFFLFFYNNTIPEEGNNTTLEENNSQIVD